MKAISRISRYVAAVLLMTASLAQADVVNIGNGELNELLKQGVTLVDVRTAGEWQQTGVIKGSQTITLFDEQGRADIQEWNRRLDKVAPPDKPVILICRSGNRTNAATQYLNNSGRKGTIYNVKAGISGWMREGQPVISLQENLKQAGTSCSPKC
jgi:rhodanese-related sulfurtransferase